MGDTAAEVAELFRDAQETCVERADAVLETKRQWEKHQDYRVRGWPKKVGGVYYCKNGRMLRPTPFARICPTCKQPRPMPDDER